MSENGVIEGNEVVFKQYADEFCDCPGMAEVKELVREMDARAGIADAYGHDWLDNQTEREDDPGFMKTMREKVRDLRKAREKYEEAVLKATSEGYICGGITHTSGEVEMVPVAEAAKRSARRRKALSRLWDSAWSLLGYKPEPVTDGVYCSTCSKKLPAVKYGWKF